MMWRYLAGAGAIAATVAAGILVVGREQPKAAVLPMRPVAAQGQPATALPDAAPEATAETREQRRFGRYDKDENGGITRDEYLAQRRRAFARLDTDGDGRLSFEEWAVKATTKFAAADRDRSGAMTPAEFATTAVKRKPVPRCPPARAQGTDEEG
jgi:hypothetical protein